VTPEQFRVARRALSDRVIAALKRLFVTPGSWRAADMERFVAQAVPLLEGGQLHLAALTALMVAEQASQAVGAVIAPPGIPAAAAVNLRTGVDARDVYQRPFVTVYTALSRDVVLPRAVELGATRLAQIAELDLQTTYAHASRAAMLQLPEGIRPRSWRRVPVGPRNCAMCLVASTQRYHIETLNPIHPACDCQVAQVFDADPGQVLDPDLLERVHTAVEALTGQSDRGGRTPDYRELLVSSTATHGELGELLVRPGDRFTGPADL
jgi:hypothetical protein